MGLGVQPAVPTLDGGESLEKAITSVQDPRGGFWFSSVFFVHGNMVKCKRRKVDLFSAVTPGAM